MSDEPKALRELHEIREQSYEERIREGWTYEEYLDHVRQDGERIGKQLGLRRAPAPASSREPLQPDEDEGDGASV